MPMKHPEAVPWKRSREDKGLLGPQMRAGARELKARTDNPEGDLS